MVRYMVRHGAEEDALARNRNARAPFAIPSELKKMKGRQSSPSGDED
jgi:hypothetical protein